MHFLDPAGPGRVHWHIGYQDVIAAGHLFLQGQLSLERVVALAGAPISRPSLCRTLLGASTAEITAGQIVQGGPYRIISGCVLSGRTASDTGAYLGRYHQQVSVLDEGGGQSLFGWLGLVSGRYTAARAFLRRSGQRRSHEFSTNLNGRPAAMLPVRLFEKVMPLDILPSALLRALLARDTEQALALGCLELDEEDLALCSFLCPAKNDYAAALRIVLDELAEEL